MKAFKKWADSLNWTQLSLWCIPLIGCAVLAFFNPFSAAFYFLLLISWMTACVRCHKKKLMTTILIGCLLFPRQSPSEPTKPEPQVAECNSIVIGGLVVVVGVIIVWKLVQFCEEHLPTPPPPPPPPGTNSPPSTNASNFKTTYTTGIIGQSVSGNGWMDRSVPTNPVPFLDFISLSCESSTNLTDWGKGFTVNLWLSSNGVASVVYDSANSPVWTNYTMGNPYRDAMTNFINWSPVDSLKPKQFFRKN